MMKCTAKIFCFIFFLFSNVFVYANQNTIEAFSCFPVEKNREVRSQSCASVVSPDKQWVAFIKRSHLVIPNACNGWASTGSRYANEVWIYNVKTSSDRLLVADNFSCREPTTKIVDPWGLQFSPNGKTLYFLTSAWVTSGALHAVDVDGKNLRFVVDGNAFRVIKNGKYQGDLIVSQHRYRFKGDTPLGSYDWLWLFNPAGKQIKLYKKE